MRALIFNPDRTLGDSLKLVLRYRGFVSDVALIA